MKHLLIRAPRFWFISHALHIWKSCKCWLIKCNNLFSVFYVAAWWPWNFPVPVPQNRATRTLLFIEYAILIGGFFSSVNRKLVLESFIAISIPLWNVKLFIIIFYCWIVFCITLVQHTFTVYLISDIRRKPYNIYSLH